MPCPQTIVEPLCIPRGALFKKIFDVYDVTVEPNVPIDLSDRDWRSQIRRSVNAVDPPFVNWNSTGVGGAPNPQIFVEDIPSEAPGNNGRLRIQVGAVQTAAYTFVSGVYDIEGQLIADPEDVWRLSQGDVEVDPDVTRDPPP